MDITVRDSLLGCNTWKVLVRMTREA